MYLGYGRSLWKGQGTSVSLPETYTTTTTTASP